MADLEHNEVQHQLAQSSRITNPQSLKTEQCLLNSSWHVHMVECYADSFEIRKIHNGREKYWEHMVKYMIPILLGRTDDWLIARHMTEHYDFWNMYQN